MKTSLLSLLKALWKDDRGFIVSAELVLVGTIAVLSMVVGLSAVSRSITRELYDVADAYDAVNQNNNDADRYDRDTSDNGDDYGDIVTR